MLLKRGHSVVTTVRSREKAQSVLKVFQGVSQDDLDFAVVPDIAAKDAFHGLGTYGLEAAIHVASPVSRQLSNILLPMSQAHCLPVSLQRYRR